MLTLIFFTVNNGGIVVLCDVEKDDAANKVLILRVLNLEHLYFS